SARARRMLATSWRRTRRSPATSRPRFARSCCRPSSARRRRVRRLKTSRTRELFEASGPAVDPVEAEEALTPEERALRAKKRDQAVEVAAVRLLSRREHSTEGLRRKLAAKGHPESSIETVLDKLGKKNLLSDERFAASYVHHHARRGQGPVRIRAELRQQGIDDSQIQQEVGAAECDWNALAAEVRRR